jgi:hypothetical protein
VIDLFIQGGTASYDQFANAPVGSVERRIYDNQVETDSCSKNAMTPFLLQLGTSDAFSPVYADKLIEAFMAHPRPSAASLNPTVFNLWLMDHREEGCYLQTVPRPLQVLFAYPFRTDFPYMRVFDYQVRRRSHLISQLIPYDAFQADQDAREGHSGPLYQERDRVV